MFSQFTFLKHPVKKWFYIGIVLHLLAAFFSNGFLHWDEHFQQIEFLNFKLGSISSDLLPWEYAARIRPWLQPFIYFCMTKISGITNPFLLVSSFQLLSSVLGILATFLLCEYSFRTLKKDWQKKWAILLLNMLWFIPLIHARISAESFGSSLFCVGISFFFLRPQEHQGRFSMLSMGFILCLASIARFQIGIMVLFFFLWLFFIHREKLSNLFIFITGALLALGIGAIIDRWGYGDWAFPALGYLKENILNNKAANYGVAPFWHYFSLVMKKTLYPFGILIIPSTLLFWYKKPLHVLTWITLPFFLIHSLIGHKEMRFLIPLAPFLPFFIIFTAEELAHRNFLSQKLLKPLLYSLVSLNIALLLYFTLTPLNERISFFKFTYHMKEKITKLAVLDDINPYYIGVDPTKPNNLKFSFYDFHRPQFILFKDFSDFSKKQEKGDLWVFISRKRDFEGMETLSQCHRNFLSVPKFVLSGPFSKLFKRTKFFSLYQCRMK